MAAVFGTRADAGTGVVACLTVGGRTGAGMAAAAAASSASTTTATASTSVGRIVRMAHLTFTASLPAHSRARIGASPDATRPTRRGYEIGWSRRDDQMACARDRRSRGRALDGDDPGERAAGRTVAGGADDGHPGAARAA